MLVISLLLSAGCSALSSTIMRRIAGSSPRRLARSVAGSVPKRLSMPSFAKRSTLRYIVRSGVPVSLALSATELSNKTNGRSSS